MALRSGSRLGPYEITAPIGVGGMGEVYRATDTNLKRQVAIKVLPDALTGDAERLARFQREAEVLASLNHPNIAAIYGLERTDGQTALVMELVEGPTLADRIAQGAIPVEEALPIAKQIAEALEAAHEQGVIHRDLKPANIKVRPDGTVKVLDFGLAKAMEPSGVSSVSASMSPTITTPAMTQAGIILGTAAYMSPEQARGKAVDKRADIWASGCVLYEMLTGKRAFEGEEVSDVLASVLAREPDWTLVPRGLSPVLGTFLKRCLHKDRRQRIGDAQSLRLALEGAFEIQTPHAAQAEVAARPRWQRALPVVAALVGGGLLAGLGAWSVWPTGAPPTVNRFDYALPEGREFRSPGRTVMALSPDGRRLVYNAIGGLYLRSMDALEARLIPGTEAAVTNPFFSPDGESVGFYDDGQLRRISISGGAAVVIGAATNPFGVSWERDNTILFGQPQGIMRVSANGGMPELVIKANEGEQMYGPQLLPDGDSVLFSVTTAGGPTRWDQAQIVVQSLRRGERKVVLRGGSDARYVPSGQLVYAVSDTLLAIAFDARRLEVNGGPLPVVEGLMRASGAGTGSSAAANYSVSEDGALVYVAGDVVRLPGTLVWVDRSGKAEPLSDRQAPYAMPRVSPDGARVAVRMQSPDGNDDIWVVDAERGTHTRLTSDPETDTVPLWRPDGKRLVFSSGRTGANALMWMAADGSGASEELTKATTNQGATSWLPDGTTLVYYDVGRTYDIFTLKPGDSPVRFSDTPFREQGPAFSPDGRWLAFSSNETGQAEIYVTPYPGPGGRIAISSGGGRSARWSPNGGELFYRNGRQMMVVAVEPGATFRVGTPRVLFEGDYLPESDTQGAHNYDVTRDGQRFVMIAPTERRAGEETRARIVVVQNWDQQLARGGPVN